MQEAFINYHFNSTAILDHRMLKLRLPSITYISICNTCHVVNCSESSFAYDPFHSEVAVVYLIRIGWGHSGIAAPHETVPTEGQRSEAYITAETDRSEAVLDSVAFL